MSPDDDWALGQNEVDVRNEARNPLNVMPVRYPRTVLGWFACRNPEQAWIDESRAEAEREEK